MTEYLTEEEQIQQLKNWLKQYGLTILIGIIIALVLSFGWRYWQQYQNKILLHASSVYDEMLTLKAQNNLDGVIVQAKKLQSHYPSTPYAEMAAFMLANDAVLKNNYQEGINQLTWVLNNSKEHSIREIARIRIARILLTENKSQEALDLLKKVDDKNFIGLVEEVKGDAYLLMQDSALARKSYQLALKDLPNAEVTRPILQMKFDNLATG